MPSDPSDSSVDTQTQILDTAERLFAEQGFGATSLRSIIRAADVNLAAIHYHFGSKDKLIFAAVQRMAKPIVESEIELLKAAEAKENPLSLETILHAFFAPGLEIIYQAPGDQGLIRARFMGRCRIEPEVEAIAVQEFSLTSQLFTAALQKALPDKPIAELNWKFDLAIAMLIRVLCAANRPGALLQGKSPKEIETAIQRLVRFTAAGMKS
ncbi:MAG: TetR/AcrR family transcriptional regulator [Phormidesmis sp.]